MRHNYPDYYKDVFIYYISSGEIKIEKAWLAINDNEEYVWTLSKDNTTIIPDKYVTTWISIYK